MTRGEKVIAFIERYCVVPEGDLVGQSVRLAAFQKKFILDIYDNPHITDTAILSMARKNAKTATIAFLVLAHLVGPEAVKNSHIISGAMSREQASEVYKLASKCVLSSPELSALIKIIPSSKKLIGLPMGVEYQAISAEGKTAHGKSPILAILDEVGQIRGPNSDFVDAIITSQGAYTAPLLIYISTQAATDSDYFSILIDDALLNTPKKTVCHLYCADKDGGVLDEAQWYKANPALGIFCSKESLQKAAENAARMPSFENAFRNLHLNQRVASSSPAISRSVWDANAAPPLLDGKVWFGGLDLSSRNDLTAFTLISENSEGKVDVEQYFWVPEQGLLDREKRDKQSYSLWVKQGFIKTVPSATVDYEYVAEDILSIIGNRDIRTIAFDRWRIDVFKKALENRNITLPLSQFGQGFKTMAPAFEALESDLLNGKVQHGANPVLRMCAANAITVKDPSGARKLDKSKATGRIDGLVSLTMAYGVLRSLAETVPEQPLSPWEDPEYSIKG